MSGQFLPPLPVSDGWLERYRIECERRAPRTLIGSHQRRHKGASLEFHDFNEYLPGDDFRHIDWRVTARRGGADAPGGPRLIVRNFVAEEQMRLVISVDTRATMNGPSVLNKSVVALWLAQALATITLRGGDQVVLHDLFRRRGSAELLKGGNTRGRVRAVLERFQPASELEDGDNLARLQGLLPPASIWIIISDFYGDEAQLAALAREVNDRREGYRIVLAIDVDSWPYERSQVQSGEFQVEGPGVRLAQDPRYELNDAQLKQVEDKIAANKNAFFSHVKLPNDNRSHWVWPAPLQEEPGEFFRRKFESDRAIAGIFAGRT
jgi:hypothetical protein